MYPISAVHKEDVDVIMVVVERSHFRMAKNEVIIVAPPNTERRTNNLRFLWCLSGGSSFLENNSITAHKREPTTPRKTHIVQNPKTFPENRASTFCREYKNAEIIIHADA
jgi:hypothetical protein